MNRSTGAYVARPVLNFGIVLHLPEGGYEQIVVADSSRRFALGKAIAGRKDVKIVFCKAEPDMSNDERGQWDMPSYRPAPSRIDYSVLDLY